MAVVFPVVAAVFPLVRNTSGDSVGVVACRVVVLRRSWMPSVSGLLEERELAARRRVEGLREEADR
ncbi:hypothetical protein ACFWSF_35270, partial [Streptomyces sp. NPDC058611]